MAQKKIDKVLIKCFKEMFKRVGLKYPDEKFTSQKDWYLKKTWSRKEDEDFCKWMEKVLQKDLKWPKKLAQTEAAFFNLNYGWKTK